LVVRLQSAGSSGKNGKGEKMPKKDKQGNPIDPTEHKGNLSKVKTMRFVRKTPKKTNPPGGPPVAGENGENKENAPANAAAGISPTAIAITGPTIEAQGFVGNTAWVIVAGPSIDEDPERQYCELSYTPPGANAQKVIIETGDAGYPFDGTAFFLSGLPRGNYIFTAYAVFEDHSETQINQPIPVVL
jgi:hypothetical protein